MRNRASPLVWGSLHVDCANERNLLGFGPGINLRNTCGVQSSTLIQQDRMPLDQSVKDNQPNRRPRSLIQDRKSVLSEKRVSVRVDLVCRILLHKNTQKFEIDSRRQN